MFERGFQTQHPEGRVLKAPKGFKGVMKHMVLVYLCTVTVSYITSLKYASKGFRQVARPID